MAATLFCQPEPYGWRSSGQKLAVIHPSELEGAQVPRYPALGQPRCTEWKGRGSGTQVMLGPDSCWGDPSEPSSAVMSVAVLSKGLGTGEVQGGKS